MTDVAEGDAGWVQVPPELALRLDVWAELLLSASCVWRGVTAGLGAVPAAQSPVFSEDAYLNAEHPDWGPHPAWQAGMQAAKLIDVASHHGLGVRALIKDRQLIFPPGPLLRAETEYLARACWIIDPDVTPPDNRVARLWLEHLHSAHRHRWAVAELGDKEEVNEARRLRDVVRAEIEKRFPGAKTECRGPEERIDWLVGGEKYPSFREACERFALIFEGGMPGLYDALAYISHPSTQEVDAITAGDLTRHAFTYEVQGESVITQVGNAAVILNLATSLVAMYFGLDQAPIEQWHKKAVASDPGYFGMEG